MQPPPQRVSPVVFPREWALPSRPDAPPQAIDAYRQTEFGLRADLRLLERGMNLQLRVVADSYPASHRTQRAAAFQLYWSRLFQALSDAALLVTRGSYPSVPSLLRTGCECLAAAVQLGGDEHEMFAAFLAHAFEPDETQHATSIGRGSYLAGGRLAAVPALGAVCRAASELSRPNIGATLLAVAPESNRQKLAVLFADQSFHHAWAQLELGWLLTLCQVVLDGVRADGSPMHIETETRLAIDDLLPTIEQVLTEPQRCRIEEVDEHGERRFLVVNFRRQPGGAPRKILL
jgi:hypothetical protein